MENVVEVKNLSREYNNKRMWFGKEIKKVKAINDISFNIKKGEVFGLLGPNGAGKSTTIKILTTLLAPTSGECKVLGHNTFGEEKYIRNKINFVFGGESGVYTRLTAKENLIYFANLYKINRKIRDKRIKELLEMVGLAEKMNFKVETFSKGMIQRLQIARGLINDPEVLFLDEPTIGLDPVAAKKLRNIVKSLSEKGKTVLLTTHYMHEADELCDRIAIINKGNLIALDTPENLKKNNIETAVLDLTLRKIDENEFSEIEKIEGVEFISSQKNEFSTTLHIHYLNSYKIDINVLNLVQKESIISIATREITLEDVYLKLIEG